MKKLLLNFFLSIFFISFSSAQSFLNDHDCGTTILFNQLLQNDPAYQSKHNQFEQSIYNNTIQKLNSGNQQGLTSTIKYIPVVVHIVHNNGGENLSDGTVQGGIQYLNDIFANSNQFFDSAGVNTEIQFCLAQQDTNGVFTTGITRTQSLLTEMIMENDDATVKGLSWWNTNQYLNIWVVREITSLSQGPNVGGYATFPSAHGTFADGIMIEARWFGIGPNDTKVLAHECGHYLGLLHTFEGGCTNNDCLNDGDKICDTPPDASTVGITCLPTVNSCTTDEDDASVNNPFRSTTLGGLGDQYDLFQDYMDYGLYACFSLFTQGQSTRMNLSLTTARSSLLNSIGCQTLCTNPIVNSFTPSATSVNVGANVSFTNNTTGATTYDWQINSVSFSSAVSPSYTFNTQGTYVITLIASNGDVACTKTQSVTITVICPITASFNTSITSVLPGQQIVFTNTSVGGITYSWMIDATIVGTGNSLNYSFNTPGGYNVFLIASDGICSDTSAGTYISVGQHSPKQTNNWYFGMNTGISFATGVPQTFTGSGMSTPEGCVSLSDDNGNLLFYGSSNTVYNKNNNAMNNGSNLLGGANGSASQGAFVVQMPGSQTLYYYFTVDEMENNLARGFRYNVIDMSLQFGLGQVTSKNNLIQSNVTERLSGTQHCNGKDIWIVVHDWNSSSFEAYLLTDTGLVTTPVTSTVGMYLGGTMTQSQGTIRFSHNGSKLVMTNPLSLVIQIFDFDTQTGVISNPNLSNANMIFCYGIEFSPNDRYLYIAHRNTGNTAQEISQFDMQAGSPSAIINSKTVVGGRPGGISSLQLGPDGKIYGTEYVNDSLVAINNPNAGGLACNFVNNAVYLSNWGWYQLPNFMSSYFIPNTIDVSGDTTVCLSQQNEKYSINIPSWDTSTYQWTVLGNATINSQTDSTIYLNFGGGGTVLLVIQKTTDCSTISDTLFIQVSGASIDLGSDTSLCTGSSLVITAPSGFNSYMWQNGSTTQSITATSQGVYVVTVSDNSGCTAVDSLKILSVIPYLSVNLGNDTTVCPNAVVVLNAGNGYSGFMWQDFSGAQTYTAYLPGTYWVTVTGPCVSNASDTVIVSWSSPPNISTLNDTTVCNKPSVLLNVGSSYQSYFWQNGSTDSTLLVNQSGVYFLQVTTTEGCVINDSAQVSLETASVDLGDDEFICPSQTLVLNAGGNYATYQWQNGATDSTFNVNQSGSYWVTVSTPGGCLASDTVHIDVENKVLNLGADFVLCDNQTVQLKAQQGFTSYLWNNGSTQNSISTNATGTYWVNAYSDINCKYSDTIILKSCTQIDELLEVNPNPNNGIFNLTIHHATTIGNVQVNIYNAIGQLIFKDEITASQNQYDQKLDLGYIASGAYFIRVNTDYTQKVFKLIVNKE